MDPIDRLQAQITDLSGSSRKPWVTLSYAHSRDRRLRLPLKVNLLNYRQSGAPPPWIVTTQQENPDKLARLQSMGARLLPLPGETDGRVHLPALLDSLADLGIT